MEGDKFGDPGFFYSEIYPHISSGSPTGRAASVVHQHLIAGDNLSRKAARKDSDKREIWVEVGAGSGQHACVRDATGAGLPDFVYLSSDLMAPSDLHVTPDWANPLRADALRLPLRDSSVDRLIASCLLIHLKDPEAALSEWRRIVRSGATISIHLPNEGSLFVRALRKMTTGRQVKSLGFQGYELLLAREHPNRPDSILHIINFVFREDRIRVVRWPFRLRLFPWLFLTVHITKR